MRERERDDDLEKLDQSRSPDANSPLDEDGRLSNTKTSLTSPNEKKEKMSGELLARRHGR